MAYTYNTHLTGVDENGSNTKVKISAAGRVPEISFTHMSVHEDGILVASDYTSSVSTAGIVYLVKAPTGKELHCEWLIEANGPVQVDLKEALSTSVTDDGTGITQSRYNRNSTISDTDVIHNYITPTL